MNIMDWVHARGLDLNRLLEFLRVRELERMLSTLTGAWYISLKKQHCPRCSILSMDWYSVLVPVFNEA